MFLTVVAVVEVAAPFGPRIDSQGLATSADSGSVVGPDDETGIGDGSGTGTDSEDVGAYGEYEEPLAWWDVEGDGLVSTGASGFEADAERIWGRFTELVPSDERQMVVGFELLDAEYEGAFVYATQDDPDTWVVGVSLGLGSDLDSTLIHEFGHLLTLQASEVPPGGHPRECDTYFTGEGCAHEESRVARYVDAFWTQPMISEALRIETKEDWEGFDRFYEQHVDQFVTGYASTSPGEDLAETFMVFVLEPQPTGDDVADDKLRFFWADETLVELRDEIRSGL